MTGTSGIAEELSQLQIAHERFFLIFIREGQVCQTPPTELNALIKTWFESFAAGSLYTASLQEYKASDGYSLWCDETVCVTAENEKSGLHFLCPFDLATAAGAGAGAGHSSS